MGHTPYGYSIENGKAIVDEIASEQVIKLYSGYLEGLSLNNATKEAKIDCYHATASRMLQDRRYLGDKFYPPIIDEETFEKAKIEKAKIEKAKIEKAKIEKQKRAEKLGRIWEPKEEPKVNHTFKFKAKPLEQKYDNPYKQAEYAYSLIESVV